jgi:hypothetical protein
MHLAYVHETAGREPQPSSCWSIVEQGQDKAIAEAEMLLIVADQFGIDYNAHVIEMGLQSDRPALLTSIARRCPARAPG